ncbi:hypothetical protein RB620_12275 [Paenibacillus sp. LHD-117]|uniref:hypothetical protein n=1 Tax=Paenibacillus sp. LHD-117 TaxID=3071412 RepID=UPI0027E0B9BC|nr:hypothetical protein [Paenibacillus sp. LHD-117]MDQ6420213.1 hypothetical protein [Paenibacillus sp. LHD-117]
MNMDITRRWIYVMMTIGIVVLLMGLWQYLPQEFSSDAQQSEFIAWVSKRIVFPLLGAILIGVSLVMLKFVREVEDYTLLLRSELIQMSRSIEGVRNK